MTKICQTGKEKCMCKPEQLILSKSTCMYRRNKWSEKGSLKKRKKELSKASGSVEFIRFKTAEDTGICCLKY